MQIQPGLDQLQGLLLHEKPHRWSWASYTTKNLEFQHYAIGWNWISEFRSYHAITTMYVLLFYALLNILHWDIRFAKHPLSRDRKPLICIWNLTSIKCYSINISCIANLITGGEPVHNATHCTSWSCADSIGSHIVNWGQSWSKVEWTAPLNQSASLPGPKCSPVVSSPDKNLALVTLIVPLDGSLPPLLLVVRCSNPQYPSLEWNCC